MSDLTSFGGIWQAIADAMTSCVANVGDLTHDHLEHLVAIRMQLTHIELDIRNLETRIVDVQKEVTQQNERFTEFRGRLTRVEHRLKLASRA